MPRAACTARRGLSSCAIGAPNRAMTPSPVYWLMVPSKRCTSAVIRSKQRLMRSCTTSGSSCSASRGEAGHVSKQDGDLLALAFEGAARREDLLGQVLRGIGERCLGLQRRGGCGGGR